jgi:hypothetical protein
VSASFAGILVAAAALFVAFVVSARVLSRENARLGPKGTEGELLITGRGLLRWRVWIVAAAFAIGLDLVIRVVRGGNGLRSLDTSDLIAAGLLTALYTINATVYALRFRLVASEEGIRFRRAWGTKFRFIPWSSVTGVRVDALGTMSIESRTERPLRVRGGLPGFNELRALLRAHTKVAIRDYVMPSSRSEVRTLLSDIKASVEGQVREREGDRARRIEKP